MIRDISIV